MSKRTIKAENRDHCGRYIIPTPRRFNDSDILMVTYPDKPSENIFVSALGYDGRYGCNKCPFNYIRRTSNGAISDCRILRETRHGTLYSLCAWDTNIGVFKYKFTRVEDIMEYV